MDSPASLGAFPAVRQVDAKFLLAFPLAGEMQGVFDREQIAATATTSNRWRDLTMSNRQLHSIEDAAIINCKANVTRADGEPYNSLVNSGYVRRDAGWKLAFHQHSPLQLSRRQQSRVGAMRLQPDRGASCALGQHRSGVRYQGAARLGLASASHRSQQRQRELGRGGTQSIKDAVRFPVRRSAPPGCRTQG